MAMAAQAREKCLDEAKRIVTGEREKEYGKPEDNFALIAKFWSIYKETEFTAHDVAVMMALLKVARIKGGGGSGDSYVDGCGYLALASEMEAREIPDAFFEGRFIKVR